MNVVCGAFFGANFKSGSCVDGVPVEVLLTLRKTATPTPVNRGRKPVLTVVDQLLLVLVALRTNLTERALAVLFGVSQPTAHRVWGRALDPTRRRRISCSD